jgi:hypothetical protein
MTKRPNGKLWITTFKFVTKLEHYQVNLRKKQQIEKPNSPLTCRRKRTGFSSRDKTLLNSWTEKYCDQIEIPTKPKNKWNEELTTVCISRIFWYLRKPHKDFISEKLQTAFC